MTERHFHGQRHIRGGFDIDEDSLSPNANYWKYGANAALIRLQNVIGESEALRQVKNIEASWKDICKSIELLADLAERQSETQEYLDQKLQENYLAHGG